MNYVSRYFGAGILLALLTASAAQAGGLYLYELGTPDVGAAAAGWAARAQDAATVFTNKDRTPDLPLGEAWRVGLGARYDWSKKLAFGVGYTFLWSGDLDLDVNRGPLAGRVSGTYQNTSMRFINFYLNWKF